MGYSDPRGVVIPFRYVTELSAERARRIALAGPRAAPSPIGWDRPARIACAIPGAMHDVIADLVVGGLAVATGIGSGAIILSAFGAGVLR